MTHIIHILSHTAGRDLGLWRAIEEDSVLICEIKGEADYGRSIEAI